MTAAKLREVVRRACLAVEQLAVTAVHIEKLDAIVDRAAKELTELLADQRALAALPPAQRDELNQLAAGGPTASVPIMQTVGIGPEDTVLLVEALDLWDRYLTAPHERIAGIRALLSGPPPGESS